MLNILLLCPSSCYGQITDSPANDLYSQHKFYSDRIKTHDMCSHAIKVIEELELFRYIQHTSKHVNTLKNINLPCLWLSKGSK